MFVYVVPVFAQVPTKIIANKNTFEHLLIPGTRMYILPSKGFKIAKEYIGIENEEGAGIIVYDIVGGNYYTNAQTFTKENFELKGAKVFEYEEFQFNGFPAKYIQMQGDQPFKNIGIVFGDSTFSAMMMGSFDATNEEQGKQVKSSMLSITYEKGRKIPPFETAKFTLNDSVSVFKFNKFAAGVYMYYRNGVEDKSDEAAPTIVVSQLPFPKGATLFSISTTMFNSLERYVELEKKRENEKFDVMNGYRTYECQVYGTIKGQKNLLYQFIAVDKNTALVIQGTAPLNFESNLVEFKKLAYTIKFK